jgi:Brp/Blh family beta-carotene 15,15'-monooxygenase
MNLIRLQGILFGLIALVCILGSAFLPALDKQTELILVASLIVVLGVPHGALDTVFARELYGVSSLMAWLRFSVIYLLMVAAVVALWYAAPLLFLIGFLGISIAHFSGDPDGEVPWLVRIIYGGAIIFIPLIRHTTEISDLFSLLVGASATQIFMPYMAYLAMPWLLSLSAVILYLLWNRSHMSFEFMCLALLAYFASPLISFTVFFCAMHSARHIIRTANYAKHSTPKLLWVATLLPMLGVVILSTVAWTLLKDSTLDGRVVQIIFVGLAALTVPHMALVEQVRLKGWISSGGKG